MNSNNQVIIERDMYCPYCGGNSAVLISETVKNRRVLGCAPVGLKDGCLICLTGGCWMLISGLPLCDMKEETTRNIYGFCPCCGNCYPVNKPEVKTETMSDRFNSMIQKTSQVFDRTKNMMSTRTSESADYSDQLRDLQRRLKEGEITQDEYDSLKTKILSSI